MNPPSSAPQSLHQALPRCTLKGATHGGGIRAEAAVLTGAAWVVEPPLWKMMEFVSWDDDIPNHNLWKKFHKPPTKYIYIYTQIWNICICICECIMQYVICKNKYTLIYMRSFKLQECRKIMWTCWQFNGHRWVTHWISSCNHSPKKK
jgi:hypothetical protein